MRPNDRELGKNKYAKCTCDHVHIHTNQLQLMPDADFALAQCAHRFVAECRLEGLSFFYTCLFISAGDGILTLSHLD